MLLLVTFLIITGFFYGKTVDAQVRVNVNVNIGSQPIWGPVGYDYAQYYYLPVNSPDNGKNGNGHGNNGNGHGNDHGRR